jgi:hypothetical protein
MEGNLAPGFFTDPADFPPEEKGDQQKAGGYDGDVEWPHDFAQFLPILS